MESSYNRRINGDVETDSGLILHAEKSSHQIKLVPRHLARAAGSADCGSLGDLAIHPQVTHAAAPTGRRESSTLAIASIPKFQNIFFWVL